MGLNRDTLTRLGAFSLYGFPFSLRAPRTTMARLRRRSLRIRFAARKSLSQRCFLYALCTLAYPIMTAIEARRNLRWLHKASPDAGFSTWLRMYAMALGSNVPPVEYVAYGFEDPSRRTQAQQYLYWIDGPALQELNTLRGANNRDVQDKARFASICAAHQLAHAQSLAVFRRGDILPDIDAFVEDELWVKPVDLSASQGAELWSRTADGYRASGGRILTPEALCRELSEGNFLVQKRLRNHSALDGLTDGRIATLRVVTGLGLEGSVELLGNYLLLPTGPGLTTAGGTVISVRWEDGQLLQQIGPLGQVEKQPYEEEITVPLFLEAIELCRRAHATAFSKFVTLGWDVVVTPEGPLLLETNSSWGTLAIQQLWGPLGLTAFTKLVEEVWAASDARNRHEKLQDLREGERL